MWATTTTRVRTNAAATTAVAENWKQTESPVIKQFCRFSEDRDKEAITELTAACSLTYKCPRFLST